MSIRLIKIHIHCIVTKIFSLTFLILAVQYINPVLKDINTLSSWSPLTKLEESWKSESTVPPEGEESF